MIAIGKGHVGVGIPPVAHHSEPIGLVPGVVAALVVAGLLASQMLMGGTRLLFAFPGYGLLTLAGLAGLFALRGAKPLADRLCLAGAAIFFGYILVRASFSPVPYLARFDIDSVLAGLLVYLLTATVLADSKTRLLILLCLLTAVLGHVLVGALQFRNGDNWMPISFLQRIEAGRRASGFYGHPNHLAGLLEVLGIFGLSIAFWSRWPVWAKLLIGYATIMCYIGVILTGSRGGYLSVLMSLLVFAVLSLRIAHAAGSALQIRIAAGALILAVFAAVAVFLVIHRSDYLSDRTSNVIDKKNIRLDFWRAGLEQWKLSPWIGTGARTYLFYGRRFRTDAVPMDAVYTHNDYLQLLAEYGVAGIVAVLPFFILHVRRGLISARRLGPRRIGTTHRVLSNAMALNVGALGALGAYSVHSFFDFNLHIPANVLLMAFVFGILANSGVEQNGQPARSTLSQITFGAVLLVLALALAFQIWRLAPGEFYAEQARAAVRDHRPLAGVSFALRGLQFEKENPQLYYYLGRSRVLLGEEQSSAVARESFLLAALPAYESARRLAPLDETYWVELGLTYDSLGRFEEAEWMFAEAFRLDPKSPPIRQYYASHLDRWAGKVGPDKAPPSPEPAG